MKKCLLYPFALVIFILATSNAKAQNQDYWREGFIDISAPTSAPAGPSDVLQYDTSSMVPGTWALFGGYRTTGTACTFGSTQHIRFSSKVTSDTPFIITPIVKFGVQEFHFLRTRASRAFTIYKTSDTAATTPNWTIVTHTPSSTSTCVDTLIRVADASAKRIKLVAPIGLDTDVDSIWVTSFSAILPVRFTSVNAVEASGKIKVTWNIATEENTSRYVVERSANGSSFTEVGTLTANNASSYNWMDNAPLAGTNFYRIKTVDLDGSPYYTSVVKVELGQKFSEVIVSPNPIVGQVVNLQLSNFVKGSYLVNVISSDGQKVYSSVINHTGGSSSQSLQLPATTKAGTYTLQLINQNQSINKRIVIQ